MRGNRSIPDATVRIGENHRSQLRVGDGALIVADVRGDRRPPRQGEATHSVMVRVDDAPEDWGGETVAS